MNMLDRLIRFSSWKTMWVFLSINFAIQAIIILIMYPLVSTVYEPLDVQMNLNSQSIYSFLTNIGELGRYYYGLNEATFDMLFPIAYSLAYSLLLIQLLKTTDLINTKLKYVALLPFLLALVDVIENLHIVTLIYSFPVKNLLLTQGLALVNMLKHVLTAGLLFSIFGLLIYTVIIKMILNNSASISIKLKASLLRIRRRP